MMLDFSAYDLQFIGVSTQTITNFVSKNTFCDSLFLQNFSQMNMAALRFKAFGPLSFLEYEAGVPISRSSFKASDALFIHIILAGESREQGLSGRILRTGDFIFIMPNDPFLSSDSLDCKKLIIKIPTDFLHQTAHEFGYLLSTGAMLFDSKVHPFPMIGPLFNLLNDMLQQDSTMLGEPALVYYGKLLNSAILTLFRHHFDQGMPSKKPLHRHVKQILLYVQDNITADITVDVLAGLCQISRKSLYNLLEREVGLTPSSYVRRLKLEKAHSELKSNERVKNVTQVALKYGFTNLGRFSAQYREQIGELPSQTLRDGSQ